MVRSPLGSNTGSWVTCGAKFKAVQARAKYCPTHRNVQRMAVLEAKRKKAENKSRA
jgi:hypothetical protein